MWPLRKKQPAAKEPIDKFPERTDYPMEVAFVVAGRPFFRFCDPNNIPAGRTMAVLKYFIQLKTNTDEGFLQRWHEANTAVLDNPQTISINKLIQLNKMIGDRLKWILHPELVLKYASVVYLSEDESPYTYDEVHGDKKIEFWKEHQDAYSFFLSEPIMKLIPSSETLNVSLPKYSEAIIALDLEMHRELLQIVSLTLPSKDSSQNLTSRITALEALGNYIASQPTNMRYTSKPSSNTEGS